MNKKVLLILFIVTSIPKLFSTEIRLAPFAVYDSGGNKIKSPLNPSKIIYEDLVNNWFEGMVLFSYADEEKYGIPVTIVDANKICISERVDYLLYGYIKKNDTSWLAEIKLYDATDKKIKKEFFASDDIEHYERMLKILSSNILSGIEELAGINPNEIGQKQSKTTEVRIPISLFYWSPIDSSWNKKILGLGGINAAVEIFPATPKFVAINKLFDFSIRANLSWDIAINQKDAYSLILNSVAIGFPLFIHMHFNQQHSIYTGLGVMYEIELLNIRPKYEQTQLLYQNIILLETTVGYSFNINKALNIYSEIDFDFHLAKDGFVSIKPCLGLSARISKEHK